MSEPSLRVGFERQRRNLVIISAFAILSIWADMKPPHNISLLGTNIEMGNPQALISGFWIVFCWWFWRYSQYYHDLRGNETSQVVGEYIRKAICDYAIDKFNKEERPNIEFTKDGGRTVATVRNPECQIFDAKNWEYKIQYVHVINCSDTTEESDQSTESKLLPPEVIRKKRILAYLHAYLRTRMLTEYYVPFGLAFLASTLGVISMSH